MAALPGLRDVRAPLISGYMWLLVGWVLVRPNLDDPPRNEVLQALYDLVHQVGPVGTAAAVSVLAYLSGAVLQGIWLWLLRRLRGRDRVEQLAQEAAEPQIQIRVNSTIQNQQDQKRSLDWTPSPEAETEYERMSKTWPARLDEAADAARASVRRSFEVPPHLLIGGDPAATLLLAAVDQKKAESELRCTAALPLFALAVILSASVSFLFVLAAAAAVVLLAQGLQREDAWRAEMREAMQLNRMTILGMTELDQAISEIAREFEHWRREHAPRR